MKLHVMAAACSLALFNLAALMPAHAQQSRMKACADEWNAMKAANQTAGKTYRAFQKECLARTAAAAPSGLPAVAPADAAKSKSKGGEGRQAMLARQRACAADWKAAKAAGTVPAGMTWPKYWSECNTRKKAEGM